MKNFINKLAKRVVELTQEKVIVTQPEVLKLPHGYRSYYKTGDSYKAAFLVSKGARLSSVKIRSLQENKRGKLHRNVQWTLELENVPNMHLELWNLGRAECNPISLKEERLKIKDRVRKVS